MGGAILQIFHLLFMACSETNYAQCIALWSNVLPYGSNGCFQIRFYWLRKMRLWTFALSSTLLYWETSLGRRPCVQSVCDWGYRIILGQIIYIYIYIYIYIMTVNYMILYSINTSHIELNLFNYSILYSVQYMQYNTVIKFRNSTIIGVWTVLFRCVTPCELVYV